MASKHATHGQANTKATPSATPLNGGARGEGKVKRAPWVGFAALAVDGSLHIPSILYREWRSILEYFKKARSWQEVELESYRRLLLVVGRTCHELALQ